jgi:glycerate 2-kinase
VSGNSHLEMSTREYREALHRIMQSAIAASDPVKGVLAHLPKAPVGRTIVVGAGKAAGAMAAAIDEHWSGSLEGVVITRYGHGTTCDRIKVIEAGHPIPDEAGEQGDREIMQAVSGLSSDDLVIALISGGGSALLSLPRSGITLQEKQAITNHLLKSGAGIAEINTVRKHLSAVKGGRLALAAAHASIITLLVSDIPGDDVTAIASGPTLPDRTTQSEAIEILKRYRIDIPASVRNNLVEPPSETIKASDALLSSRYAVVASAKLALSAAARAARDEGYTSLVLGDWIEGEAREVGAVHAGIALSCAENGEPMEFPCAIISGGETSVTVRGDGRGGRNAEFLVGLALGVRSHPGIAALAVDSDGIDGSEDNAGAVVLPDTLERAAALGIDLRWSLANNDCYTAFSALGDLIVTGPTRTNVNDIRIVLVFGRK